MTKEEETVMRKFYEKSEIWFAVTWIIIYVVVMGNLRNNFGDESPYSMLGVLIIAAILTVFIAKNRLTENISVNKSTFADSPLNFAMSSDTFKLDLPSVKKGFVILLTKK